MHSFHAKDSCVLARESAKRVSTLVVLLEIIHEEFASSWSMVVARPLVEA